MNANRQGSLMIISIVNRSASISDAEVLEVIRAINRQIREDFEPYWSFGATLRLEGSDGRVPDGMAAAELRGDAILYLWDQVDLAGALGYHAANYRGIPYGFVFTELCKQLGELWSVTLSHEALELLADPQTNLLVQGPHPVYPERNVFHWFEMCDAVQAQTYAIDGVAVSNFVLPLYFTPSEEPGGRTDFLGYPIPGGRLPSFGISPGGYVGFFDPQLGDFDQAYLPGDELGHIRAQAKRAARAGRGMARALVKERSLPAVARRASTSKVLLGDHRPLIATVTDGTTAKWVRVSRTYGDRKVLIHTHASVKTGRTEPVAEGSVIGLTVEVLGTPGQKAQIAITNGIPAMLTVACRRIRPNGSATPAMFCSNCRLQ